MNNKYRVYSIVFSLIASYHGYVSVVKLILLHSVAVNISNSEGKSPLWIAWKKGHLEIVNLLLSNKAEIDQRDKEYLSTPLYRASQNGHFEVVCSLLKYNAEVDLPNIYGCTPLQVSYGNGHEIIALKQLSNKANINSHSKEGCTVLNIASVEGHVKIVNMLIKQGSNL